MTTPVLESGDRLDRAEFHRRYEARPDIRKAELVRGVVYVSAAVRRLHAQPHGLIVTWLGVYVSRHPGLAWGDNATVWLGVDTEVQPDVLLARPLDGNPRLRQTVDGYYEGVPDLVVEVAASSASYDLHDKLRAYEAAGVPEYLVWRVLDRQFDWFRLAGDRFARVVPDARGIVESAVFPGLRLDVERLLAEDAAGVLAALD